MKKLFIQLPVLLFIIHCIPTAAQSPAASPAPPGPPNVTAILEKDGRFTIFIKLLQSTKVADNLNSQLNDSNQGLTLFSPPDSAFSSLKTGMLNSFTDDQKVELVQFHVLPYYLPQSQFQTASNPMNTQAGGSSQLLAINVTLPPPPPAPSPMKKHAPKASPAYSAPADSSGIKCQSRRVIHATICVVLVLAAVP